jgi:hypothetical protein
MATINVTLGANDVLNVNTQPKQEKQLPDKEELYKKLRSELITYAKENKKRWWYEVWIDLSENFDAIYEEIKEMAYKAQFDTCLGFLQRMDDYYASSDYIDDLNDMIKNLKFKV